MMYLDLTYREIYPNIFVYSNLLPDHYQLHEIMRRSEKDSSGNFVYTEWTDWFIFGKYCHSKDQNMIIDDIKKTFNYDYNLYKDENLLFNRLNQCVTAAISHYIAINNVQIPDNSYVSDQNIARYNPGVDSGEGKTMQYHTDYAIGEWYWPGEKFLITATTYMNDDYEGGELMFSIGSDIITYKPKAGDIVIFPSGSPLYPGNEPYFHAVGGIKGGSKSLVRMYLKYTSKGTEKWYQKELEYGKEEWLEIAKARAEGHNSIAVFDNKPRLCSSLITKLYGIPAGTYDIKDEIFYEEDENIFPS